MVALYMAHTMRVQLGLPHDKMKVPKKRRSPPKSRRKWNNINKLQARGQRLIIVNESRTKKKKLSSRTVLFDSDAKAIGIDNRCSACISHDINDFVGPVLKSNKVISAFGDRQQMKVYKGTIAWSWTDDDGLQTKFRIPNSYYVPEGKSRLLSPQHWASVQPKDTHPKREVVLGDTCGQMRTALWKI